MMVGTEVSIMTLTHFKEDERKANPRAAMVRVEIRDCRLALKCGIRKSTKSMGRFCH